MMSRKLRMQIAILATIGLTIPTIGLAAAPSHIDDISVTVSYADLNINREAGAKVLYARLQRASERVCDIGPFFGLGSVAAKADAKACYEEALTTAVEEIDSDALGRIHNG